MSNLKISEKFTKAHESVKKHHIGYKEFSIFIFAFFAGLVSIYSCSEVDARQDFMSFLNKKITSYPENKAYNMERFFIEEAIKKVIHLNMFGVSNKNNSLMKIEEDINDINKSHLSLIKKYILKTKTLTDSLIIDINARGKIKSNKNILISSDEKELINKIKLFISVIDYYSESILFVSDKNDEFKYKVEMESKLVKLKKDLDENILKLSKLMEEHSNEEEFSSESLKKLIEFSDYLDGEYKYFLALYQSDNYVYKNNKGKEKDNFLYVYISSTRTDCLVAILLSCASFFGSCLSALSKRDYTLNHFLLACVTGFLLFFLLKGGGFLFSTDFVSTSDKINTYSYALIAVLVGLYTKLFYNFLSKKLRNLEELYETKKDDQKKQ